MLFRLLVLFWFAGLAFGQVVFVSPEQARKIEADIHAQKPVSKIPGAMLPDGFASWKGAPVEKFGSVNAGTLVGSDAPIVVEYQYQAAERRRYVNAGRTITAEAFWMKDASGSYGLFTFLRNESWQPMAIAGTHAATRGDNALLRKENVLVRISGSRMSTADLSALASSIQTGEGGPLPTLPRYLPEPGMVERSTKYVLGPQTLARVAPTLPGGLVDFTVEPEVELGEYREGTSSVHLLLVNYPTAQIATLKLKGIVQKGAPLNQNVFARRSGPILAFVFDTADRQSAERMLEQVQYSGDVTWNQRNEQDDAHRFGRFMISVFILAGAWILFAMVAGLLFGIVRLLVKRWYPEQVFDRPEETEVIRLNLNG